MGDVDVGARGRMIDVGEEARHAFDVVDERQVEWLELDSDFEIESARVFGELAHVFNGPLPLIFRGDHFLLPNIFAKNEQEIFAFEFVAEIEVALCTMRMEVAHGFVEIRNAERAADGGAYRKIVFAGRLPNQTPFFGSDLERVSENINRVEADLLRKLNSAGSIDRCTLPCGVNQPQLQKRRSQSRRRLFCKEKPFGAILS